MQIGSVTSGRSSSSSSSASSSSSSPSSSPASSSLESHLRHSGRLCILHSASILVLACSLTLVASEDCVYNFSSLKAKNGNFTTPNWPGQYPDGVRCIYNFEGTMFETINITFIHFELEPPFPKGCLTDYIDISTITSYNVKRLIGRYCGTHVPSPILSMHSKTEIIFKSNHVINKSGFVAFYTFIDEGSVGPPVSMVSTINGCGGMETGAGGIITTPNFPLPFPRKIDCMWLIRVRQDQHIYLKVVELQLFGSIANCKDAHLAIYDGYENFDYDPQEPKKYCGDLRYYKSLDDKVELSARNRLLIRFMSDITAPQWESQVASQEIVGFKLVWTAIKLKRKEECSDFLCQKSEFCLNPKTRTQCPETYFFCIDRSLLCNGLPNCSEQDPTDEDKCSVSIMAGAAAGTGAFLLFLIMCFCCCRRRCRSSKGPHQTSGNHNNSSRRSHQPSSSSRANLNTSSDGSMQLRELQHSPVYGSRPDGLNFFSSNNTSTAINVGDLSDFQQHQQTAVGSSGHHHPSSSSLLPPPPPPLRPPSSVDSSPVGGSSPADIINCSVHGPRALLQVPGSLQQSSYPAGKLPTDV